MFPKGYTVSGGDITQYINLRNTFGNMFYVWTPAGTGSFTVFSYSLFYLPFYLLSVLGVSASAQSFLFFFIFLGSSYASFFLASKRFVDSSRKRTFELRILISLIYAINPFTLYAFLCTWDILLF